MNFFLFKFIANIKVTYFVQPELWVNKIEVIVILKTIV